VIFSYFVDPENVKVLVPPPHTHPQKYASIAENENREKRRENINKGNGVLLE